jgi:DHA1 family tetracycline resistance protein-like MFS transporter
MANPSGRRQAAMPFIMVTVLLDMMSIGIIAPVLPKLIGGFMDSGSSTSMGYGAAQAAFAIAQFFSAPILGALSDQYGRRPVLLWACSAWPSTSSSRRCPPSSGCCWPCG